MVEGLLCLYVHAWLKLLHVFISRETEFIRKVLNVPVNLLLQAATGPLKWIGLHELSSELPEKCVLRDVQSMYRRCWGRERGRARGSGSADRANPAAPPAPGAGSPGSSPAAAAALGRAESMLTSRKHQREPNAARGEPRRGFPTEGTEREGSETQGPVPAFPGMPEVPAPPESRESTGAPGNAQQVPTPRRDPRRAPQASSPPKPDERVLE